jgi:hypothetical protein
MSCQVRVSILKIYASAVKMLRRTSAGAFRALSALLGRAGTSGGKEIFSELIVLYSKGQRA